LRLILRQYAATQGHIHWGGHPLADYTLDTLHQALSWVPQEPFLFSASVAENIGLAKADATRTEIENAARLACVDDDIARMPQGYDTPVGEKGISLSGGQRQRVAIARALLADASLLLLDDALSAVDTQTETSILQHLLELRQGSRNKTTIIVSHRLSAVKDAEHILVLKDGCIAEQGDHASLLAQDNWYAAQWRYQQLEASLDAD
jgi:ATP-binding cassette subfamily B protein/ATP-binding cassette subfamily C protein/ATP-binding cassette subfamily B multidrug efflux pump